MQSLLYLIDVAIAVGVAFDASHLNARRGALGGGLRDMGPAGWFFACLLLWIVALPCYLTVRPRLVRRATALATHPQFAGAAYGQQYAPGPTYGGHVVAPAQAQWSPQPAPPAQVPAGPPPGYYPDPERRSELMRWWDGSNWA